MRQNAVSTSIGTALHCHWCHQQASDFCATHDTLEQNPEEVCTSPTSFSGRGARSNRRGDSVVAAIFGATFRACGDPDSGAPTQTMVQDIGTPAGSSLPKHHEHIRRSISTGAPMPLTPHDAELSRTGSL